VYCGSRNRRKEYTSAYYVYKSKEEEAQRCVAGLRKEISILDRQPPDLFLALPRNRDKALQWLFFLYMPIEFQDTLSLAHLGQSMLWHMVPAAASPRQDLRTWFTQYNVVHDDALDLVNMALGSQKPRESGPLAEGTNIRQYGKETGVLFPDRYDLCPYWRGTDPFGSSCRVEDTARLFTEKLGSGHQMMQEFLVLLPNPSPSRGNLGIATQNKRPEWLIQEEYLSFASLRAFPRLQLRQLLSAMVDNLLPFDHPCVHVLVQQLLYQVGFDEWKTDVASCNILSRFCGQLYKKADILKESPNNSGQLLLFGLVSSFFAQFSPTLILCSRRYTRISRSLADQIGLEVRHSENVSPDVCWKQAKLYGCALLATSVAETNQDCLLETIELIVLITNKKLFATEQQCSGELDAAIQRYMTKKIHEVLQAVSSNLEHLTKCLRLIVETAPSELTWIPISYGSSSSIACFEALEDHHYSINVLNGTVLVDGVPPGFLSSSIVGDALYRRTFGSRNFESVVCGVSHFRTARLVDDRYIYEFKQNGGLLQIFEFDQKEISDHRTPVRLQLLPHKTLKSFGTSILLLEPYSHWYSDTREAIFVRDPSYKNRSVRYAMTKEATYNVPTEDKALAKDKIFAKRCEYEMLVMSPPQVLEVLTRVESSKYILAWVNQEYSRIRFCLPRVGLEFSQDKERAHSTNFSGFFLRENQCLEDTLPGVTSYLILTDKHENEKVLIPNGRIDAKGNVALPDKWNFQSFCHIYDVHRRFGHLVAKGDIGRLQLACAYAATSSLVAESRSGMTGTAIATELVRQCWTNEPLSSTAKEKLVEVSSRSNLSSTLKLVCAWIWKCSNSLDFLRQDGEQPPPDLRLELDPLAMREYHTNLYHARLLPEEELYLLGSRQRVFEFEEVEAPTIKSEAFMFVEKIEAQIKEECVFPIAQDSDLVCSVFPLDLPANATFLETTIHDELLSSWKAFCSFRHDNVEYREKEVSKMYCRTREKRYALEHGCIRTLNEMDSSDFVLAKLSGAIRPAVGRDLMRLTLDMAVVKEINPFLSKQICTELKIQAVEWMVLCVLEDKLRRIIQTSTSNEIMEEIKTVRQWSPWNHVNWLVFEVEQQLQIRPYQYSIVKQLLDNDHSMVQLNMGLGKTSVLVPMLILELAKTKTEIVRINMLVSIIAVVKESYRLSLTASVQHIKILSLPFQRDFPLDQEHAVRLSESLVRCNAGRSCLLVTPQHRNSLLLKQFDQSVMVCGLQESFIDVIDESDAVLHQSFQLVYALGEQEPLPDGQTRWTMIETFLQIFAESECDQISIARNDSAAVHCEPCPPGTFPHIRLLKGFEKHQEAVAKALCRQLIANPPHEFLWMRKVTGAKVDLLVNIMSDSQLHVTESIESDPLFCEYTSVVLAARGCIACGLLFHCLRARHRVNYGIDTYRKKMAVPFFASDTPKDRAEFSHPGKCMA
jgi:hypothetical protein